MSQWNYKQDGEETNNLIAGPVITIVGLYSLDAFHKRDDLEHSVCRSWHKVVTTLKWTELDLESFCRHVSSRLDDSKVGCALSVLMRHSKCTIHSLSASKITDSFAEYIARYW